MSFPDKEKQERWHQIIWWLCVISLPWMDKINNACLILLTIFWIAEGDFKPKWQRLKLATWAWPFLIYYLLLVAGMLFTADESNGLHTLEKKITFFVLPFIVATGRPLDEKFIGFLKRSFVYSCASVVIICMALATYFYFHGVTTENFDIRSNENFTLFHPDVSPVWAHFSYIQLAQWADIHPGYLSMYLVFCLVIIFNERYQNRWERNIHVIAGCLILCALVLLASRMAIVAFVCITVYLGIKKIQEKRMRSLLPIFSSALMVGFLLWLNPVALFRVIEEPIITTYHADQAVIDWNSVSYRLLEWQGSWSVIRTHWLEGVGTGGSAKAMNNFYAHYNNSTIGLDLNAHNQYLQVWMESGLAGLLAFLLCIAGGIYPMRNDSGYFSFILIFSLMCLTESVGERQKGIVFFMLFQVLFLGSLKREK
jgi:O-antigen ligase